VCCVCFSNLDSDSDDPDGSSSTRRLAEEIKRENRRLHALAAASMPSDSSKPGTSGTIERPAVKSENFTDAETIALSKPVAAPPLPSALAKSLQAKVGTVPSPLDSKGK